jgi:hypothetical protein
MIYLPVLLLGWPYCRRCLLYILGPYLALLEFTSKNHRAFLKFKAWLFAKFRYIRSLFTLIFRRFLADLCNWPNCLCKRFSVSGRWTFSLGLLCAAIDNCRRFRSCYNFLARFMFHSVLSLSSCCCILPPSSLNCGLAPFEQQQRRSGGDAKVVQDRPVRLPNRSLHFVACYIQSSASGTVTVSDGYLRLFRHAHFGFKTCRRTRSKEC